MARRYRCEIEHRATLQMRVCHVPHVSHARLLLRKTSRAWLDATDARSSTAPRYRCASAMCRTCSAACACRSEEHTSELQSQSNLVCRLLLEKKKKKNKNIHNRTVQINTSEYK